MSFGKIKADTIAYTHPTTLQETDASVSDLVDNANLISTNTTDISTNTTAIAAKAPLASPQFTGIPVATGDGVSTDGQIQLNCSQNTHGVKIKSPPHSAAASYTLTLPDTTGTTGEFLKTDGSGALSWDSVDLSAKADLASPTFTGTPTAPTATTGDDSTQIATTEFVNAEIASDLTAAIGSTVQAYDADTAKTDVAQTFTAAQRGSISAVTVASGDTTKQLDFATANNFELTLENTASCELQNPTNLTAGQSGSIFIVQDATGSRLLTYGSSWDFAGGTAPTISTAAASVDRIDYIVRSSTSIHAVATLAYS